MPTTAPENTQTALLQAEIQRLRTLLDQAGIDWRPQPYPQPAAAQQTGKTMSAEAKIALFRQLFRGREDVYPLRWQSRQDKAGYSPACANEWQAGVCGKPKIKCSTCPNRRFLPLTEQTVYRHLAGLHTIGIYPLLPDDTCYFLVMDVDKGDWQADAAAVVYSCRELQIPVSVEQSRSGNGAHLWWFFADAVPASLARQLGAALISHTCRQTRQLSLQSYDRLFPNQDTLPKGGLGNLIALPLQKQPRAQGYSEFVDEYFRPFADQWAYLRSIKPFKAA
ncbi:TOTE conflict system archaeo-eukaryotic primase domain-containing protein [Paralysiella testudinis]|uniref:TOTE conflict system primase domain-containing protein n=1 Tax=Paralysiella testudinis TaxID=2809020 RepID=A0A892ZE63_9NEIS|nr:hypothetical protein [Paralysiella testudinis]QRQ81232.1 hypothetical protein JQU52_10960 [Paralysiella testudinis]